MIKAPDQSCWSDGALMGRTREFPLPVGGARFHVHNQSNRAGLTGHENSGTHRSERARRTGAFYSGLVHLLMTDALDVGGVDQKAKSTVLIRYVEVLGPAFVDKYCQMETTDDGDEIYLSMNLAKEMT